MNLANITAIGMGRLANQKNKEIFEILADIQTKAKAGKTELYLNDKSIEKTTKEYLEDKGFIVESGGRYNEVNTIIIWELEKLEQRALNNSE